MTGSLSVSAHHSRRTMHWTAGLLLLLWSISAVVKLHLSYAVIFDYDIVPVVSLGWGWLHGGAFPVYGTLSSVAAYNLPGLVWLHLPALLLVDSPWLAIVLTLLFVNMLGTMAVYALGRELGSARVALCAAVLFTFSETSFSASTIAWAQLILPSLYAGVALGLLRWQRTQHAGWMALAGVLAVFAFMIHFSAVLLLPLCGLFWLCSGARLRWRWVLGMAVACGVLLAPYLVFQVGRDFQDMRSFLSRQVQIDRTTLRQTEATVMRLAKDQSVSTSDPRIAEAAVQPPLTAAETPVSTPVPTLQPPLSLSEKVSVYIQRVPREVIAVLSQQSYISANVNPAAPPPLAVVHQALALLTHISLIGTLLGALCVAGREIIFLRRGLHSVRRGRVGRVLLLALLPTAFVGALLVLRVYPTEQPTYLAGLQGWGVVLASVGFVWALERGLRRARWVNTALVILVGVFALAGSLTYVQRRDLGRASLFPQAWYYDTLATIADSIAPQVGSDGRVRIAYELWPQQRGYWWVPAWSLIDERYRLGMALDFVLLAEHGIINTNTSAYGVADNADFIVRFAPDLPSAVLVSGRALVYNALAVYTP